jgi:hypothetical protein
MAEKNVSSATSALVAALKGPSAPRALLVSLDGEGGLKYQPVTRGQSVVDLRTELIDHLNAAPFEAKLLEELRDYCDAKLAALAESRRTGGFVIPREPGRWEIAHVNAFSPLEV